MMLHELGPTGRASERKLRMFACACGRAIWPRRAGRVRSTERAVEAGERFADGLIDLDDLEAAARMLPPVRGAGGRWGARRINPAEQAILSALAATEPSAWDAAREALDRSSGLLGAIRCDLIREVFGNPFRTPNPDLSRLEGSGGSVLGLAREIYESRDFEALPILADALEEAGCDDRHLLDHLHESGGHVLGCWALDLVLDHR